MTRRKNKDLILYLEHHEHGKVLDQLLKGHPDLRGEANGIAESLLDHVSVEAVSKQVARLVLEIDREMFWGRSGRKPWGYVEPGEAAWELLERAIEGVQNDMKRRMRAGVEPAAEMLCQGLFTMIEENLALPFVTKILGMNVSVEKVDLSSHDSIIAICRRGSHRQAIRVGTSVPPLSTVSPRLGRTPGDSRGQRVRAQPVARLRFDHESRASPPRVGRALTPRFRRA